MRPSTCAPGTCSTCCGATILRRAIAPKPQERASIAWALRGHSCRAPTRTLFGQPYKGEVLSRDFRSYWRSGQWPTALSQAFNRRNGYAESGTQRSCSLCAEACLTKPSEVALIRRDRLGFGYIQRRSPSSVISTLLPRHQGQDVLDSGAEPDELSGTGAEFSLPPPSPQ